MTQTRELGNSSQMDINQQDKQMVCIGISEKLGAAKSSNR